MQLFHRSCGRWKLVARLVFGKSTSDQARLGLKGTARLQLINQNLATATRTYQCQACGTIVHIDMDWPEGACREERANLT